MSITLTYMIQDEVNFYLRDATRVWSQKRRIKEPDNYFKARNWILILLFTQKSVFIKVNLMISHKSPLML